MLTNHRKVEWWSISVSVATLIAIAGITIGTLASGTGVAPEFSSLPPADERSFDARLAALDQAIARRDMSRAVYEWRDAYGLALGSRRWDAMAAVGDRAVRVDAIASPGHPGQFRAEARQAYLRALFDARTTGSTEGIRRVADAFATLGDADMAARARAMARDR
jgi:hypothetical protein